MNYLKHSKKLITPNLLKTLNYSTKLSHVDSEGNAKMVDTSHKQPTSRTAIAEGLIKLNQQAFDQVKQNTHKKGDVLTVSKIAGIQAAKRTSDLIPLCHPLPLNFIDVQFNYLEADTSIKVTGTVKCNYNTGVEMEALTLVSTTCLTIFDMCKAVDPLAVIQSIKVIRKTGGKSDIKV
jgi:cyclic pyranopterin phosphate synthase